MSDEAPEQVTDTRASNEDRKASARKAFAEAMVAHKPVEAAPAEPDEPTPAWMDPEVARLRRELAAKQESLGRSPEGQSVDDLIDRPGQAVRGWLESVHGEKFANDTDFKTEAADLITRLANDVLGVPLPDTVRVKLDNAAARKTLKHMKSSETRRETERTEKQASDAEWSRAVGMINQRFAAGSETSKTYPLLAAEHEPGQTVIEVVRAANDAGEHITFEEAAKLAEKQLRSSKPKATPAKVAPASPPKVPTPRRDEPVRRLPTLERGKWDREAHRAKTLAALRKAHSDG